MAAVLRLVGLGTPDRLYFDETFYANDAHEYLEQGVEVDRPAHPPLGKWLIAAGIAALGFDPVGWRVAAAVAGTLTVLVTYLLGLRLFRSEVAAALSALLLALDGLALTMSRIAMLDGFLALFVVLGAGLLVLGHRRPGSWRLLAGVAFGCAAATKWSGVLALGVALLLVGAEEVAGARAARPRRLARRLLTGLVVPLVVVPFAVYLVSWAGWFANYERTETGRQRCRNPPCAVGVVDLADAWIDEQVEMYAFQRRLEATHPDRSPPQDWPLLTHPVLFYLDRCDPTSEPATPGTALPGSEAPGGRPCSVALGNRARILGAGNPALWWPGAAAMAGVTWVAARRRSWPALLIAGFALGQYVPWFASWKPGFSFYLLPATPFVALALGWAVGQVRGRVRAALVVTLLAVALAGFVWFRPIWYGQETSPSVQEDRLWFDSWR